MDDGDRPTRIPIRVSRRRTLGGSRPDLALRFQPRGGVHGASTSMGFSETAGFLVRTWFTHLG